MKRLMIGGSALVLVFVAAVAAAAPNNGIPDRLERIEAVLRDILGAVTSAPPSAPTNTRILFPFVTNQAGFDTGISVANTGLDSTGTVGSAGTCTIYYFGRLSNGTPVQDSQTTDQAVNPGEQFTFVLSTGGGLGIVGRPTFQGYIEVDCNFPLAHGFGLLTDGPLGASRIGTTIPALVLESSRTTSGAESAGQ